MNSRADGMVLSVTVNTALDRVALVRGFAAGGPMRPRQLLVSAGGSGIHAGRVARTLGAPAVVQGLLGGHIGRLVEEAARREGLVTDFTQIDGESRINYVIVDEELGYRLEVPEPGPTVSAIDIEHLSERYRAAVHGAAVVVLSSGLPPGCPESIYAELVQHTPPEIPVIVDTHSGALDQVWDARPEIIKVNEPEFAALVGAPASTPFSPGEVVEAVSGVRPGPRWLAVTLAERGAVLVHGREAWHGMPPPVGVFNPSGSGDAFVGSLAASLWSGDDMVGAFPRATAAGAGNVRGLAVSHCDPIELAALVAETTFRHLSGSGQPMRSDP